MAKIRINGDTSGYVEIAALNAANNNTLEIGSGTKILTNDNLNVGNIDITNDTNDTTVKIEATASGKDSRLELIANSTGLSQIRFGDEASVNPGGITYDHTNNFLALRANSSEKLRITSTGSVGIGTTNPATLLDVYNDNIQISTTSKGIDIFSYSPVSETCGQITFYRSTGSAIGVATTSVENNNDLGRIDFRGWNSIDNAYRLGASITAEVDGVADSNPNHMPTSMAFKLNNTHTDSAFTKFEIFSNGSASLGGGVIPWLVESTTVINLNVGKSFIRSRNSVTNNFIDIGTNCYLHSQVSNAPVWKFLSNNSATRYQQGGIGYSGEHVFWRSTTSGPDEGNITWVPSFRLGDDGQVGIGSVSNLDSSYGTAGQVLTSGGTTAAPSWSGGSTRVLEYVSAPCNGQSVLTSYGSKTTQNAGTAGYQLTTTFSILVGSQITYRPPTGTHTVIYRYSFQCSNHDTSALAHFKFYIGTSEVTYARYTIRSNGFQNRVVFEWPIKIGGSASASIGQLASWNSDLILAMEARDYSSSYDTKVNMTNHWDGAGTDQFSMPTISITALGS